ncbi:MAG TPA: hypothetical protein VFQ26_00970, partial [Nitrospiraceae bacterium]|nr:hypothetical protein [Nitrospiraceae bacterium]
YDTSGDGFCTALDVLLVINFLNGQGSPEGEAPDSLTAFVSASEPIPTGSRAASDTESVGEIATTPPLTLPPVALPLSSPPSSAAAVDHVFALEDEEESPELDSDALEFLVDDFWAEFN